MPRVLAGVERRSARGWRCVNRFANQQSAAGQSLRPDCGSKCFGLVAPPPPPDPSIDAAKNLPKITPTGIQSFYGHVKALFKVAGAPAKPGQPAKDLFYILSQGQRQDDIEVTKIDEKNNIVTFSNHGITQELPLVSAPSSGGAPAAASPAAGNPGTVPGVPVASINSGPGGIIRFGGGTGGRSGGAGNGANNPNGGGGTGAPGAPGGLNFGGSTQGRTYQPEASDMTQEQTAIVIEAQRAVLMNTPIRHTRPHCFRPRR